MQTYQKFVKVGQQSEYIQVVLSDTGGATISRGSREIVSGATGAQDIKKYIDNIEADIIRDLQAQHDNLLSARGLLCGLGFKIV